MLLRNVLSQFFIVKYFKKPLLFRVFFLGRLTLSSSNIGLRRGNESRYTMGEKIVLTFFLGFSSASSSTPTQIQGFGGLCVIPQGQSPCPAADGTELIYSTGCQGEGSQFILSNGILIHKCSNKKICPQGGQNFYGTPLVIDNSCDDTESKFERTEGKYCCLGCFSVLNKWLIK